MKEFSHEHIRASLWTVDTLLQHLKDLRGAPPHLVPLAIESLKRYVDISTKGSAEDKKQRRSELVRALAQVAITLRDDELQF